MKTPLPPTDQNQDQTPGDIKITPEEDAILDQVWAEIAAGPDKSQSIEELQAIIDKMGPYDPTVIGG